jgi:hypothetical protein
MPVVNLKSTVFKADSDPLGAEPKPELARGRPIVITGSMANGATDSAASKYLLGELPSDCILDTRTFFKVDLWGFADIRIGTFTDPAALVTQTKATEAIATPVDVGDAKHGMPLWQACGLAADPGGNIGIYAHAAAGATGAGSMKFEIHYRYR